jgi:chromosome segregation ATPase
MSPEEIQKKITELTKRTDVAAKKKATAMGQLQEKKEQLSDLIKEIKAAGYDPKTLPAEKERLQAELEADISKYEKELTEVEKALAAVDSKK